MHAPLDIIIYEDIGWGFSKMKPIVDEAVSRLGLQAHIQLISSPLDIEKQNFDQLPVLMVNDQVIVKGRVPSIFTMPALIVEAIEKNTAK